MPQPNNTQHPIDTGNHDHWELWGQCFFIAADQIVWWLGRAGLDVPKRRLQEIGGGWTPKNGERVIG